jgi:predicted DNA-binding transcriptional regulator YafY
VSFDPNYLAEPRIARVRHSPEIARWKLERGARALTDRSAVAELPFKTTDWLVSEVLADRGESVVLEPPELRAVIARRARELQAELELRPARRRRAAGRA